MADNVEVTPGTGEIIAADQVTRNAISEKQQIVKLGLGAEGAFDLLVDSGQQTMANSMPVALASDQSALPITDNSGSLTVDNGGTFPVQATVAAGATNIAKAEDAASADGDVGVPAMAVRKATPGNTSGADGDYEMLQISGGRLYTSATVDAALPAGTNAIGKLAANDGVDVGDVTVNNASGASAVNIQDGGNSLTVDQATASNLKCEPQGPAATDAAVSGNPVYVGSRASDAVNTAMSADGDMVPFWLTRRGALVVANAPHIPLDGSPWTLTSKTAQYTSTQTGVALWTPASGKKLVITQVQIQVGGTTAGTLQLWFGASADTTYSRGTDLAIFDGEFAPSSTQKPGVTMTGLWIASAVDHILRVTDSAAINPLTVTVWGYES